LHRGKLGAAQEHAAAADVSCVEKAQSLDRRYSQPNRKRRLSALVAASGRAIAQQLVEACGGTLELADAAGGGLAVVVSLHNADAPVESAR